MQIFQWKDSYSVGIEIIDRQHKKLVRMLSDLLDAMHEGKGNDILLTILQSLTEYTIEHFNTEEQLMDKYGYPFAAAHKIEHAKLRNEVNEFLINYSQGNVKLTVELMNYLSNWLRDHILGTDKKLGHFLIENKVRT